MPLPWMKMWLEALDDLKLIRLSLAERGAWWGLLQLAGKCDAGGKIVSGGQGLGINEIIDALHLKSTEDKKALKSMIAKMEDRGSLTWNDNILTVVHYEERQKIPPSSQPAAVAERVRQHRERKKQESSEPTEEQKMESEYRNRLSMATLDKKKELGRRLNDDELKDIVARIRVEVYGEEGG